MEISDIFEAILNKCFISISYGKNIFELYSFYPSGKVKKIYRGSCLFGVLCEFCREEDIYYFENKDDLENIKSNLINFFEKIINISTKYFDNPSHTIVIFSRNIVNMTYSCQHIINTEEGEYPRSKSFFYCERSIKKLFDNLSKSC